jgi:hypothetical protein
VALLASAMLINASAARACNEFKHASARAIPRHLGRAPLEIGDSTSIFAAPILGHLGIEADAHGCRQFGQGLQILSARRHTHTLPHVVVLALGANGPISLGQISAGLSIVGRNRILALVTPPRSPTSDAAMRLATRRHPSRVLLIDWERFSAGHGGWFAGDGLHVGQTGAQAFARLIKRTIRPFAFPPVHHLHLPRAIGTHKRCGIVHQAGRALTVAILRGAELANCTRARALVRAPPLRSHKSWQAYDWRATRNSPWQWVYLRRDRKVIIAAARTRRKSRTSALLGDDVVARSRSIVPVTDTAAASGPVPARPAEHGPGEVRLGP